MENKYLKLILDDLHKSIIVGEALQMELTPPEDIQNDMLLLKLTTNIRKIHIKFYDLKTELDYIHRTISQLAYMIVGDDRSKDPIEEKTNTFTATGRQPKRNPAKKFEQREQSSKLDKDIELLISTWRHLKEKEINLSASKQEMEEMANKIKEYEHNYEKMLAEHQNLTTDYTTLQKRLNEDNEKHKNLTEKFKQLKTQLRTEKDKWMRVALEWKYKYEDLERTSKECTEYSYKKSLPDNSVQYECVGGKDKCSIDEKEALDLKEREELDLLKKIRSEEKRKYEEDLERNREQIKYLEDDINDLLNRMCSEASERLDHDNPIITDLSDQSKPTQISERYLELYVNQWIDAFHLLQTNHHLSNTKAIEVLLDVLSVSFNECKEARKLGEDAVKALKRYIGEDEDSEDVTILEVMKALKDNKRNIKKMQETFNQHVHSKLATEKNYKDMLPGIRPYINECVDICLLMNIQEPPLELRGLELLSGSTFDSTAFQSYIESGNKIKYIVWPAMYLYQNGPLLRKGIAQGMRDSSNVLRPTDTEHDANKNDSTTCHSTT